MAMVQTKRLAALLLALLLTLFLLPSALADSGVVSGTTVSGTVRVYLSSISSLTAVDVSIAGSYSVGGDTSRALSRGQNIRVSNSGGTLMMTANGQTQTMGSRFKLRRHQTSGENGVRIAQLDERSYRALLWEHRPLTDFWRVGRGYAKKLEEHGLYTMGDVARCSIGKPNEYYNEGLLYKLFGVNAELLIDHAWGWEPCRMADIKAYRPETNSISSGQVLQCPYPYDKARLVVREMAEAVALELLEKRIVTDQLTLTVGYDIENTASGSYRGETVLDPYGRKIPKHAHGTATLGQKTSSVRRIVDAVLGIYDEKADPKLTVRRLTVTANRLMREENILREPEQPVQFSLFDDPAAQERQLRQEEAKQERERRIQEALLDIKKKYGKNAILSGGSYLDGATARERNRQIGGHKA